MIIIFCFKVFDNEDIDPRCTGAFFIASPSQSQVD